MPIVGWALPTNWGGDIFIDLVGGARLLFAPVILDGSLLLPVRALTYGPKCLLLRLEFVRQGYTVIQFTIRREIA
jgi:hypothetical protein